MRNAVYLVSKDGTPLATDGDGRLLVSPGDGKIVVDAPPAEGSYHLSAVDGEIVGTWEEDA